jgi:arylsulfatase A-like enzyme
MNVDFSKPFTGGPSELGFDYFFGTSGCTTDDPPMCFFENDRSVGIPDRFAPVDPADEDRELLMVEEWRHEDADIEFKNRAINFIKKNQRESPEKPFFIYLPLSVPHIPWFPPDMVKGKSGAGPRGDQVILADWIVGEIIKTLEELKITDNTLVIFSSDNGPRAGINGHASAWKWRGYKGSIWEGGYDNPPQAGSPGQLYNLGDDPREEKNLYHEKPEVVFKLKAMLEQVKKGDYRGK